MGLLYLTKNLLHPKNAFNGLMAKFQDKMHHFMASKVGKIFRAVKNLNFGHGGAFSSRGSVSHPSETDHAETHRNLQHNILAPVSIEYLTDSEADEETHPPVSIEYLTDSETDEGTHLQIDEETTDSEVDERTSHVEIDEEASDTEVEEESHVMDYYVTFPDSDSDADELSELPEEERFAHQDYTVTFPDSDSDAEEEKMFVHRDYGLNFDYGEMPEEDFYNHQNYWTRGFYAGRHPTGFYDVRYPACEYSVLFHYPV